MKRKLLWIGAGCWFPDSLLFFKEHCVDVTVIRVKKQLDWFKTNYAIFATFGFKIVSSDADSIQVLCQSLDKNTLIVGGGYFGGDVPSLSPTRNIALEELDILHQISKYNHDNGCGAKILRYFNGDMGFGSQTMLDLFDQKIRHVDTLMFDNDLLRDFVLYNSKEAQKKRSLIGYMETPLKRHVLHNTEPIERRMISMGRCFSQFDYVRKNSLKLPIRFYPQPPRPKQKLIDRLLHKEVRPSSFQVAGRLEDIDRLYAERKAFVKWEGSCAFGLSHMNDVFYSSVERFRSNRDYYWSLDGQLSANGAACAKEQYYSFVNNPSKDVAYMMFGIIPLISHTENSYYKTLVNKKMAILIKKKEDLRNVLTLSDKEIQEYRDNIYANRDLFTFDHVGETLMKIFEQ